MLRPAGFTIALAVLLNLVTNSDTVSSTSPANGRGESGSLHSVPIGSNGAVKIRDVKLKLEEPIYKMDLMSWLHGHTIQVGNVSESALKVILNSLKLNPRPESSKYPRVKVFKYQFDDDDMKRETVTREVLMYTDPDERKRWIVNIEDLDLRQNLIIFRLGDLGFSFPRESTYVVLRKTMVSEDPFHYFHLAYISQRKEGNDLNVEWDNITPKDMLPIPLPYKESADTHANYCQAPDCDIPEVIFGTCFIKQLSCNDLKNMPIYGRDKERMDALIREGQPFIFELAKSTSVNERYLQNNNKNRGRKRSVAVPEGIISHRSVKKDNSGMLSNLKTTGDMDASPSVNRFVRDRYPGEAAGMEAIDNLDAAEADPLDQDDNDFAEANNDVFIPATPKTHLSRIEIYDGTTENTLGSEVETTVETSTVNEDVETTTMSEKVESTTESEESGSSTWKTTINTERNSAEKVDNTDIPPTTDDEEAVSSTWKTTINTERNSAERVDNAEIPSKPDSEEAGNSAWKATFSTERNSAEKVDNTVKPPSTDDKEEGSSTWRTTISAERNSAEKVDNTEITSSTESEKVETTTMKLTISKGRNKAEKVHKAGRHPSTESKETESRPLKTAISKGRNKAEKVHKTDRPPTTEAEEVESNTLKMANSKGRNKAEKVHKGGKPPTTVEVERTTLKAIKNKGLNKAEKGHKADRPPSTESGEEESGTLKTTNSKGRNKAEKGHKADRPPSTESGEEDRSTLKTTNNQQVLNKVGRVGTAEKVGKVGRPPSPPHTSPSSTPTKKKKVDGTYFQNILAKIKNGPPGKYTVRPLECVGCERLGNFFSEYETTTLTTYVANNIVNDIFKNISSVIFSPDAEEVLKTHRKIPYIGYGGCFYPASKIGPSPKSTEYDDLITYYSETLQADCDGKDCASQKVKTRLRELLTSRNHLLEIWPDRTIHVNKNSILSRSPILSTSELHQFMVSHLLSAYTIEYRLHILDKTKPDQLEFPKNQSLRMQFQTKLILLVMDELVKNYSLHFIKGARFLLQLLENKYLALVTEYEAIVKYEFKVASDKDKFKMMNQEDRLQTLALKDFIINGAGLMLKSGEAAYTTFTTFYNQNKDRIVRNFVEFGVDRRMNRWKDTHRRSIDRDDYEIDLLRKVGWMTDGVSEDNKPSIITA